MSEYWKSTPKYWCKHCGIYVRDTKLDRANHESTGKHQGAIKRSLRELHRGHEQQEREKERARREVERLNGVVSGTGRTPSGSSGSQTQTQIRDRGAYSRTAPASGAAQPTEAERQRQLEQLADLGVNIPTELRGNMALAGDWTVTSTRVVPERLAEEDRKGAIEVPLEARATGVRKREREKTEEEKAEEQAVKGLFKKPRRWGRDTRDMPGEGDEELEELLRGELVKKEAKVKDEEGQAKDGGVKEEEEEEDSKDLALNAAVKPEESAKTLPPLVKQESGEEDTGVGLSAPAEEGTSVAPDAKGNVGVAEETPTVVFKKRKPKNIRQK